MKWFKKQVDERQEMDLLKVEHIGFWFMYWLLLAEIVIQGIFMENGGRLAAGEWIAFMATSVIVLVGCVRKGVWSFYAKKVPGVATYLKYSVLVMAVVGIPFGVIFGIKWHPNDVRAIAICVIYYMVLMFILAFAAYFIVGTLTKKREAKLAEQTFEDDEEDL